MGNTCNTELFEKCFAEITRNPDGWDQQIWCGGQSLRNMPSEVVNTIAMGAAATCGTTACLAGHAMVLSGVWRQVISFVDRSMDGRILFYGTEFIHVAEDVNIEQWEELHRSEGSHDLDIDSAYVMQGAEALGIDRDLAYKLFMKTSISDPEDYVKWVKSTLYMHGYDTPWTF